MSFYNKCHFIERWNSITLREAKISFGVSDVAHMSGSQPYLQEKVFSIFCLAWSTPFNNNLITSLGLQPKISLKNRVWFWVHLFSCKNRRLRGLITSGLHKQPLVHVWERDHDEICYLKQPNQLWFRYPWRF